MEKFQQAGLGEAVQSWVGTGANLPVSAEQVTQALGPDTLQNLVSQLGGNAPQLGALVAQFLPSMQYLLIAENQYTESGLATMQNLVAAMMRLQRPPQQTAVLEVIDLLHGWLADNPELMRIFAIWIRAVLLRQSKHDLALPKVQDLKELKMTLATRFEEWAQQAEQKGMQKATNKVGNTTIVTSKELLKAACCNLAESFETNPSIDVNFSDALTGTKQIKMLGLTSPYILIAEENIPSVRGASQVYGLSFVPGTWVESIQITKGAGSVVNGYESISGQINTERCCGQYERQHLPDESLH